MQIRPSLLVLLLGALFPCFVHAAGHSSADVTAEINPLTVHAGDKATVAVIVDVHDGLHAQSHTPSDENYIAFTVTPDDQPGVTFGPVVYPAGDDETYPLLGKLNVYIGKVIFDIPVKISADAKPGPITLSGTVYFQACNDKTCFPPETIKFSVQTTVVAAAQAVAANTDFPHESQQAAPQVQSGVLFEFAAAFVIGMIFNLMPCVLPVLPLKIMGFYEASKHDRKKSIALGAVFSLGLIACFAVLAVLIVGSTKLSWGAAFHNKLFTLGISLLLLIFAFGTFGFFDVNLPPALYSITHQHDTYLGNFLFGIFTAILSTPCTFGVFATLLAWAVREPPLLGGAALVMVGVGMAFPYFVLSAFPEVARRLPRSGPWSNVVKQMMGFFLLGSAVFFAKPLFPKVSTDFFWWLIFAVIAASGVFLVYRSIQLARTFRGRGVCITIALLLVVPAFLAIYRLTYNPYNWIPYSDQSLASAKASGKPVLVDFTADWCTTCHYIEGSVLNNAKVVKAIKNHDVIMIKADMTNDHSPGQPLLSKLTAANEIPLTLVYLPNTQQPKLLNGIYSTDDLLKTLNQAN